MKDSYLLKELSEVKELIGGDLEKLFEEAKNHQSASSSSLLSDETRKKLIERYGKKDIPYKEIRQSDEERINSLIAQIRIGVCYLHLDSQSYRNALKEINKQRSKETLSLEKNYQGQIEQLKLQNEYLNRALRKKKKKNKRR